MRDLSKYEHIQVIDIPAYTAEMEILENEIKNGINSENPVNIHIRAEANEKNLLDYLELLEGANKKKDSGDWEGAVLSYKTALYEKNLIK